MTKAYPTLTSPLKIGPHILKNRMGLGRSAPTYVTGVNSEYPLDTLVRYGREMARNGAAIVTCPGAEWPSFHAGNKSTEINSKGIDLSINNVRIAYARLTEAIHNHGSLASISLMRIEPAGYDFNDVPLELLESMPDIFADICADYKSLGFDMCCFYMSYCNSLLARSISPVLNKRADKYGGNTMTERAKFSIEVISRVREKCGSDFLIELQISGEEAPGGYTVDDLIEYARAVEGLVDIFQLRGTDMNLAHPVGFNSIKEEPITLKYAEALKKSGVKILAAPIGGFQDPRLNEKFLVEGKADLIYMARAFICDNEYAKKIAENRPDDITPCVRCNRCHSKPGNPQSGCTVNPEFVLGYDDGFNEKDFPFTGPKKVAIIGGGPGGMKAALTAAKKGHIVTLYEKTNALGGQLKHADYADFKWPLREFKDFLIAQLKTSNVHILLETEATPELLADKGYDAILVASGAVAKKPPIPGAKRANVFLPDWVFGNEDKLGRRVVVIGGSEMGTEAALYLAEAGHQVTVLTRNSRIAHDAQRVHYREMFEERWERCSNFSFHLNATTTEIGETSVTWQDSDGTIHTIEVDSVVACGGMEPVQEYIEEYGRITPHMRVIGDCRKVGNVRTTMKSAYTAAAAL